MIVEEKLISNLRNAWILRTWMFIEWSMLVFGRSRIWYSFYNAWVHVLINMHIAELVNKGICGVMATVIENELSELSSIPRRIWNLLYAKTPGAKHKSLLPQAVGIVGQTRLSRIGKGQWEKENLNSNFHHVSRFTSLEGISNHRARMLSSNPPWQLMGRNWF